VLSPDSSNMLAMPMTPFRGVRSSWLMLAKNSSLARLALSASEARALACSMALPRSRLAASAFSLARLRFSSTRRRSVMSTRMHTKPAGSPSPPR